jgi:elongation factor Ts
LNISLDKIKNLRELSGAGIMNCRNALIEAEGNMGRALEILKEQNILRAEKKADRVATQGLVECYTHIGGRIGSMVELNCETDFVARTDEFKQLAHNLAMQIAACCPLYISEEEIPQESEVEPEEACLLRQPYIKDLENTVQDIINDTIARVGENIKISRFARFDLGEQSQN